MSYETHLKRALCELLQAHADISDELRAYPTPVSGCDAQYNHMIGVRNAVSSALQSLRTPPFVATPRSPVPQAGIESR